MRQCMFTPPRTPVMPQSHERIFRRFGSVPGKTISYRILSDVIVTKRALNLPDVFPYVGARWQTYGRVTGALYLEIVHPFFIV